MAHSERHVLAPDYWGCLGAGFPDLRGEAVVVVEATEGWVVRSMVHSFRSSPHPGFSDEIRRIKLMWVRGSWVDRPPHGIVVASNGGRTPRHQTP